MLQTWDNSALDSVIIRFFIVEVGNQDLALSLLLHKLLLNIGI